MNAVNAVQLFILVWTFTAVCRADDDDISITCEDVTGAVGEEVTLTCNVSLKRFKCCITKYKFQYKDCRQEFPLDSCEQRNSFTCRYTPTTAMTGQIRFLVQTTCGWKDTEFTVNITEPIKPENDSEAPVPIKSHINPEDPGKKEEPLWDKSKASEHKRAEGCGFKVPVIGAVISSFIIVIMAIIYKMKQNYNQNRMFLNNSQENCPVNVV